MIVASKHPSAEILYQFACDFVALNHTDKLQIGIQLGILREIDCYLGEENIEMTVFSEAHRLGKMEKLVHIMYTVMV